MKDDLLIDLGAVLSMQLLFKGTTLPGAVVRRGCQLHTEGFVTYQVDKPPSSGKVWELHRRCTLSPSDASHFRVSERHLRKAGPLRMLASRDKKNALRLYCLRVDWPERHAPHGGASLELGFESLAVAQEWWRAAHAQLLALQAAAVTASLNGRTTPSVLHHLNSSGGHDGDSPRFDDAASSHLYNQLPRGSTPPPGGVKAAAAAGADSSSHSAPLPTLLGGGGGNGGHGAAAAGFSFAPAAAAFPPMPGAAAGVVVDDSMMRWVPHKHSNGMAIYYRHAPHEEGAPHVDSPGEYMLSTSIAASPNECARVLLDGSSGGAGRISVASFAEVLQRGAGTEVSHTVFQPAASSGVAAALCAPRELFVHSVLTTYEEGVCAMLFSSLPDADVRPEWTARCSRLAARQRSRAMSGRNPGAGSWVGWGWGCAVRAHVRGAITLSALEGKTAADSPSTLVTAIMRADFGGWLSPRSAFYRLSRALGLQEALMDRMLMSVMVLKEEVEYSKFKAKPFQLLMVGGAGDGDSDGSGGAAGETSDRDGGGGGTGAAAAVPAAAAAAGGVCDGGGHCDGGGGASPSPSQQAEGGSPRESLIASVAHHMTNPQHYFLDRKHGGDGAAGAAAGAAAASTAHGRSAASTDGPDSLARVSRAPSAVSAAAVARAAQARGAAVPYTAAELEALAGGSMPRRSWSEIESPGDIYNLRGANYLRDRKKAPAAPPRYRLVACDLAATDAPVQHVARFLPSVRCSGASFHFVVDLMVPGTPVLHLVMVFATDRHPDSLGPCPDDPSDAADDEWTPFDFTMSRFLHGSDDERSAMFKLIPHCAKASWVLAQAVGTTPVILGRKLATSYHVTDRYIEVDIDIDTNPAVTYIVHMVQGATRSMVIDHAYLLEGQLAHELPEALIGAVRFSHLDMAQFTRISTDAELPMAPVAAAGPDGGGGGGGAASAASAALGGASPPTPSTPPSPLLEAGGGVASAATSRAPTPPPPMMAATLPAGR